MSGNAFDLMRAAVQEAKTTMEAADAMAPKIAPLLRGRLRKCCGGDLEALKRELRDFNIHTGSWKE